MTSPADDVTRRAARVLARGTRLGAYDADPAPEELARLREIVGDARVVALGEGAHGVREFTEARARLTRLLLEHLGCTVVADEFGLPTAFDVEPWARGAGADSDLAAISPAATRWGTGRLLRRLREHNLRASRPARFVGIDIPDAGGTLLPTLAPVRDYLADVDPGLLPRLDGVIALAGRVSARSGPAAIPAWQALGAAGQDALTADLARLRTLLHTREPSYLDRDGTAAGRERFDRALCRLDTAIAADHLFGASHGLPAGEGMAAAVSLRDRFMADAVRRHLDRAGPAGRIVVLAHNTHVQKTPLRAGPDAGPGIVPMGRHLARELGADYVAVALTHTAGSVPEMRFDDSAAGGVTVSPATLDPPGPTSVEAAAIAAGCRGATLVRTRGEDGLSGVDRIRAQSGWSYTGVPDAFDAVLTVPTATPEPDR